MYDQDTVTKTPPAQPSSPSPADGSTEIPLETAPWLSVTVTDPDGNSMDVSFYNASDDSPIGTDENVASGGTAQVSWQGLVSNTAYSWYAEADDGFTVTRSAAWTFTTGTENYAPDTPKEISPCGGPVAMEEPALLSVKVTDPNGDDLTVKFYDDTDPIGDPILIQTCYNVASGETASFSYDDHLDYTEWHVEVSDGQETTVSQGYWFAAWEEAYIFDPTGELSGYDWIWYEYPFEGETKTAMCRIKEMEEWVVSAIDALYPDMDDIDDGRGRHKLDEHAINGEDEVLFAEEAERNNKYIFVPYTGSSYDYADEVVFGDKDGVDPEDPENYPYGCGPLPLGRICDFNVENSLITDPAEETRIDSFFRRFKIKTVEHCSEGMELTDPIYVDFKVCGHGLDDVGAKGATVEMQLVSYTAIGEGEDYQCVYVSKKMYALVGGDPAECVYLPDEKTTDDVEYIRGALPTIQIFGKNVWDTPGLEFYEVHRSISELEDALKDDKVILLNGEKKLAGEIKNVWGLSVKELHFASGLTVEDIKIIDSSDATSEQPLQGRFITKPKKAGAADREVQYMNGIILVAWEENKQAIYDKLQQRLGNSWIVAPIVLGDIKITYKYTAKQGGKKTLGPPYPIQALRIDIAMDIDRDHDVDNYDEINEHKIGCVLIADKDNVYTDEKEPARRRKVVLSHTIAEEELIVLRSSDNIKLYENEKPTDGESDLFGEDLQATFNQGTYWAQAGSEPTSSEGNREYLHVLRREEVVDRVSITVLWVYLTAHNGMGEKKEFGPREIYSKRENVKEYRGHLKLGVHRGAIPGSRKKPPYRQADSVCGGIQFDGRILPNNFHKFDPVKPFTDNTFKNGKLFYQAATTEPATNTWGFIFRRFIDVRRYQQKRGMGIVKNQGTSSENEVHDDSKIIYQEIVPHLYQGDLYIVDGDSPTDSVLAVEHGVPYFAHTRANFKEYVVFNYCPPTSTRLPERCSKITDWAFKTDIGSYWDPFVGKAVFILDKPNDYSGEGDLGTNEVYINKHLTDLNLHFDKPEVNGVDPANKIILHTKNQIFTIQGTNLVGDYQFIGRTTISPILLIPTINDVQLLYSDLTELKFSIDGRVRSGDYTLRIINPGGTTNVSGFEKK